ncbi:MAG: hypothetical protein ACOVQE_01590 [Chitinophagaceae bacterium]
MSNEVSVADIAQSIKDSWHYLLKKWLIVLSVSILAGVVTVIYLSFAENKYVARLTFVSENEGGSSLSSYAGIAAQFGFDIGTTGGGAFEGDNLIELLKSRNLIEQVLFNKVGNETMLEKYLKNHNMWEAFQPLNITQPGANIKTDSVVAILYKQILKKRLEVMKVDKKIDFVYIQFTDNNQQFASLFTNTLAQKAIQFYTEYKTRKNTANIQLLERQVDSVRSMLFGNIQQIASVNDLNVNPLRQTLRTNTQKKQVDLQVNSVLYTELLKNLELARLTLRKETPLIQIIDTPTLPLLNQKTGRAMGFVVTVILVGIIASIALILTRIFSK